MGLRGVTTIEPQLLPIRIYALANPPLPIDIPPEPPLLSSQDTNQIIAQVELAQVELAQVELAQVEQWLDRVVIGLNLCPFAAGPRRQRQIRFQVSDPRQWMPKA